MEIFDQAVSIMEGGVEIAKRIKLSETNRPYIPSEAVPKSLRELTSEHWRVPEIMHFITYLTSTNNRTFEPLNIIQTKLNGYGK